MAEAPQIAAGGDHRVIYPQEATDVGGGGGGDGGCGALARRVSIVCMYSIYVNSQSSRAKWIKRPRNLTTVCTVSESSDRMAGRAPPDAGPVAIGRCGTARRAQSSLGFSGPER